MATKKLADGTVHKLLQISKVPSSLMPQSLTFGLTLLRWHVTSGYVGSPRRSKKSPESVVLRLELIRCAVACAGRAVGQDAHIARRLDPARSMEPTLVSIKSDWSVLRIFWKCLAAIPILLVLTITSLLLWWRFGFDWDPTAKMPVSAFFAGVLCLIGAVAVVLAVTLALVTGTLGLFALCKRGRG